MNDQNLDRALVKTLSEAHDSLPGRDVRSIVDLRSRYVAAKRRRAAALGVAMVLGAAGALGAAVGVERTWHYQRMAAEPAAAIQLWMLKDINDRERPITEAVKRYNRRSPVKIRVTTLPNEEYKRRILGELGSPSGPDIFMNWGGKDLWAFVHNGKVVDLAAALAARPAVAEAFKPEMLDLGSAGGKRYALPMSGAQPVVLFYNKRLFTDAGLRAPETFSELILAVDTFKASGKIPIAMPGADGWSELMYLIYLLDRIGAPMASMDIANRSPKAWEHSAVLEAARICQSLAARGAFGADFDRLGQDDNVASERFARGEAAMYLTGTWEFANQMTNPASFARDGTSLGWTTFPKVFDNVGIRDYLVGVPANLFSVASGGQHTTAAIDFLMSTLVSEPFLDDLIAVGHAPVVWGVEARYHGTRHAEFASFTSDLVSRAGAFTPAWGQTLSPTPSQAVGSSLNREIRALFRSEITPEAFVAVMKSANAGWTSPRPVGTP